MKSTMTWPGYKSVLVVENQKLIGCLLLDFFTRHGSFAVLGVATQFEEAVELCRSKKPAIVTVELDLKGERTGIELIGALRASKYNGKIVILTSEERPEFIKRAIIAGASAYITKLSAPDSIVKVFERLLDQNVQEEFIILPNYLRHSINTNASTNKFDILTAAERQVLVMMAKGMSVKEMASTLHKANTTIYTHQQHIREKYNLCNTNDLFDLALDYFLVYKESD